MNRFYSRRQFVKHTSAAAAGSFVGLDSVCKGADDDAVLTPLQISLQA
ncbi:MAG: twin-arginine translocation signal domain-containing protein [Verrucomicrobiales bacterium]